MTKKDRQNYEAYLRSEMYSLEQAYGRYSDAKAKAWAYCRELMYKNDGYNLKVVSKNTSFFSAGFLFINKETGEEMYMHITKSADKAYSVEA